MLGHNLKVCRLQMRGPISDVIKYSLTRGKYQKNGIEWTSHQYIRVEIKDPLNSDHCC